MTQGLLFPPETLAKIRFVDAKRCRHPRAMRVAGPRVRAVWGSLPTTVCVRCWKWRVVDLGAWRTDPLVGTDDDEMC